LVEGAVSLTFTVLEPGPQKMCGTVVGTSNDTVVVRDLHDRTPHTDRVSPTAVITLDGRPASLADLKAGDFVQLLVGSPQDPLVTNIEARTLERSDRRWATQRHR